MRKNIFSLCIFVWVLSGPVQGQTLSPADRDFFEKKVRPILFERCFTCHSAKAKKVKGELYLDSRAGILKGGESGPAAVSGHPEKSLLIKAVSYRDAQLQMPPKGKLPAFEIAVLEEWVRRGVPFPGEVLSGPTARAIDLEEGRKFWSFQPPKASAPPKVKDTSWPRRPMDFFILAELEKRGFSPAPAASKTTLIRRAYFDLIGLPPSPEEVEAFVGDQRPDAYARLIDRLLTSPHHGERWGRFWLDLARYCDIPEPWSEAKGQPFLYRDWVVKSLNDDLPYDQFVMMQLAADLMPGGKLEDLPALGFLGLSPSYWKELKLDPEVIKTVVAEEWEERIHTLTSTFLGLTVACARCHDHKFDPIAATDYYALAGVFASTKLADRYLLPAHQIPAVHKARAQVKTLQGQIAKLQGKKPLPPEIEKQVQGLQAEIEKIKEATPHVNAAVAPGVEDASLFVLPDGPHKTRLEYKPLALDVPVQIRGNPSNPGALVPRRFLAVLSPDAPLPFKHGSGRLELARAIVKEGSPLSARVIVNRIWRQHFGQGLVETPSDFGSQGERPSHPQLLDDLTARFMAQGWSIKWLHREIMLSSTYQQRAWGSAERGAPGAVDPDNRLLWRMNRRRLEVEAWRDAMLAVSGELDLTLAGPPLDLGDPKNHRRTLYGTVKRRELHDLLRLHDFPDPTTHNPTRLPTTTPLQQLFTLNSPFLQERARALARRLHNEVPEGNENRIRRAYLLLFGRPPTEGQIRLAIDFLNGPNPESLWQQYAQVLLGSNEFLFVD